MPDLRKLGRLAEDRAADHLLELGYTIVTRRFKGRHGEIDLIAIDPSGETLVFVEVKSRSRTGQSPEKAVDWTKRQHFHQAVKEYFDKTENPSLPARYDIIALDPSNLNHLVDAFRNQSTSPDPEIDLDQ